LQQPTAVFIQGVLHEYLKVPPGELSWGRTTGFSIHANVNADSGRSQNPRKYHDDALVLEHALVTETDPFVISRYTFYLAESYKDCGEREKALENYLKRVELRYWIEEVYIAILEAANLMTALSRPFEEVMATEAKTLLQLGEYQVATAAFKELQAISVYGTDADYFLTRIRRALDPCYGGGDNRLYWELDWLNELLHGIPYVDRTNELPDFLNSRKKVN